MKINLPCEIVRDLLPSYIDELTSEMSTEVVEEHLKECENCKNILGEMQKDLGPEKQAEAEERKAGFDELHRNSSSDEDKKVLLKINRKINRRLKMAILVGLLSVVLVFMTIYILYIESFKKVSVDDIAVTAKVYEIDELEIEYGTSMVTEKTGGEERSYEEKNAIIHIPGSYMSEVQISPVSLLEENEYLTVISLKSPYFLNTYTRDLQKQGNKTILYLGGFRTTFLNNQPFSADQMTHSMEFEKIDKIVYIHKDGTEMVLWENKE